MVEKKSITAIVISILITVFVFVVIFKLNYINEDYKYVVNNGIINLDNYDEKADKNIKLVGGWEFYPHIFIYPDENGGDSFLKYRDIKKIVQVPGSWESYLNDNGSVEGAGTYRITIKVPKDEMYGIKAKTIRLANRIYINGKEVASVGYPALDKEGFEIGSRYSVAFAESRDKELQLVIHISSFDYRSGGIIQPIIFGTYNTIMMLDNRERNTDALIISICFTLGIYYLLTYLQRKKEVYFLYFSLTGFLMALHFATMDNQLLNLIFDYSFMARTYIQVFVMIGITLSFLRFVHHFFMDYHTGKITDRFSILMIAMLLLSFNNPDRAVSIPATYSQVIIVLSMSVSYICIFGILVKAFLKKAEYSEYILVITVSLFCYWLAISLKIFLEIYLGHISVTLIFIIMIGIALLMSRRLQLDYQNVYSLTEKLIMYDETKNSFFKKASLRLKSPLDVITSSIKLLIEGSRGSLNSRQQEDLFLIQQEVGKLKRLSDDFMDVSYYEKEDIRLNLQPISLYPAVENIVKEMFLLIPEDKKIVLENRVSKDFPAIKADNERFTRVLYNLIHNAIKFTDKGIISISAKKENGYTVISVADTGIGIEKKYSDKIFNVFYKRIEDIDSSSLGLGLPIAKQLIESQKGKIIVKSEYGKGSEFSFSLPLWEIEKDTDDIKSTADEITFIEDITNKVFIEKPVILVVYDKASNQKDLFDVLKQIDVDIVEAHDSDDALSIIQGKKIDLVILDFALANISGDKLCIKIRNNYSMVELPILLLTELGETIDSANTLKCKINNFQKKPIVKEELKSRVQSLLLMKASVEENIKKEFQYFYSQISPHFLYNTLNTIIGLSYKNSGKAREALNNLSIYFRGKLELYSKQTLIPLDSELELAIAYLEIEKIRYEDRLNIEYDLEEGLHAMIPPLMLQPLIENAVKHGISVKDGGGTIKIITNKETTNDTISITIKDDGVGMSLKKQEELLSKQSKRLGFNSVIKRIKLLKGAALYLDSRPGEGTSIKIIIPEVKNNESYFGG